MSIGLTRTRNQIYNTSFLRSLYHGGKGWATRGDEVDVTLKPEHIVEELNRTPKLKRDLIMKMVEVMLDSEAFLEAYPRLYDPALAEVSSEYREKVREELAQIIVRLFRKNKVRMFDFFPAVAGVVGLGCFVRCNPGRASAPGITLPALRKPRWTQR